MFLEFWTLDPPTVELPCKEWGFKFSCHHGSFSPVGALFVLLFVHPIKGLFFVYWAAWCLHLGPNHTVGNTLTPQVQPCRDKHIFENNPFGILIYLTLTCDIADFLITKPLTELFFFLLVFWLYLVSSTQSKFSILADLQWFAPSAQELSTGRSSVIKQGTSVCSGKKVQHEIFIGCCLLTVKPHDNGLTFKHLGRGDPKGISPRRQFATFYVLFTCKSGVDL